jgi:predicted HTH transcriptional regulator
MRDHSACNNHVFNDHGPDDLDYEYYLTYLYARDVNKVRKEGEDYDTLLNKVQLLWVLASSNVTSIYSLHAPPSCW